MTEKTVKVLLIDDNPGDAKLIAHTLNGQSQIKFEVELQERLSKGIQSVKKNKFHIVLLDLALPDSNGFAIFTRLKSQVRGLPIIVLTGLNSEEIAIQAVRKGAQDYIVKGDMNTALLVRAISYAIERTAAEEKRIWLEMKMLHAQKLESLNLLSEEAAHEFCGLLSAIIGNAELALDNLDDENTAAPNIRKIMSSAQQASLLTEKLLGYAGKGRFLVEFLNLAHMIQEMQPMIQAIVPKKIPVDYDLNSEVPPIKANIPQIQQIMLNLVNNAVEATGHKGGKIIIRVFRVRADNRWLHDSQVKGEVSPGMHACLQVIDHGSGINPENKSRIFDPFFTTKFTNRGLGLTAVDGIVNGHGGAIRISSQTGKGTTVSILFPTAKEKTGNPQPATVHTAARENHILIVEENREIEVLMKAQLEKSGFSVISSGEFDNALKLLSQEEGPAELVILDLPQQESGIQDMLQALRQCHPLVKVILTSDYSTENCPFNLASLGVDGILKKPFRSAELTNMVHKVLGFVPGSKKR